MWLESSIETDYLLGFSNAEQKDILEIVHAHSENFKKKWNECFGK
ncbi:DUF4160 domain-containing protein [Niastella caeni]|uniref:DUF4160 domain-containing protein n=1 Tax=Niastella caeni TaxID=2569763 RepID=A0A4S8HHD6_9BACT|nr:DUF4160 domain-containing protein [Niastella caeni]